MSQHIDHTVVTETGLANTGTFTMAVNTDTADRIMLFVDDGAGNAPESYDFDIEVAYNDDDANTYMPRSSVSGSTSTHHVFTDIAPFNWQVTITNSSGVSNDYRARLVVIAE